MDCPECGATVNASERLVENEIIDCAECGSQLIVREAATKPRLEALSESGEDWGE